MISNGLESSLGYVKIFPNQGNNCLTLNVLEILNRHFKTVKLSLCLLYKTLIKNYEVRKHGSNPTFVFFCQYGFRQFAYLWALVSLTTIAWT